MLVVSCDSKPRASRMSAASQDTIRTVVPNLDLPDLVGKKREVFLSQFADSIAYIPLETTPEFMIGEKNVHVKPCGEFIFVSEHGKPVGAFDRSGKFIRRIGSIGKGPGEYNFDFIFWPEASLKQIYVWNADKGSIMAFSFEGQFLKEIVPEISPMAFAPLGNGRFLTWTFMQKEKEGKYYRIIFHDEQGSTSSRVYQPQIKYDFSRGIAIMEPLITPAPEGFLFNSWDGDTIYRAKQDGSFEPAFTWRPGKLKMPFDALKEYERYQREKGSFVLDFNAIEGPDNWFIRYDYRLRSEMAIYEKRTGEFYVVSNPDTAQRGVYNDIDGGPSFFPGWDNENGQSFVRLIHAIDLVSMPKEISGSQIRIKDMEAAKRYRAMLARLNENSNPVVMLIE
jgi:hypothetical protein